MHPAKEILKWFVENNLDSDETRDVKSHLDVCELCREVIKNYKLLLESIVAAANEPIPPEVSELADKFFHKALAGKIIELHPLPEDSAIIPPVLAADNEKPLKPQVENLVTVYSEQPELVLRVMRDKRQEEPYLQLISEDPALSANVMIRIPELNRELVTDESGKAKLEKFDDIDFKKLKWQIKMPDAVFSMEPLVYDPEKTEYSEDTILETKQRDRVRITFTGKTEGKEISVEILELDGQLDFGPVTLVVSQADMTDSHEIKPHQSATFQLIDSEGSVRLRLFRK